MQYRERPPLLSTDVYPNSHQKRLQRIHNALAALQQTIKVNVQVHTIDVL